MKMLGNNVLVTEVQKEATTAGGIILTEAIDKGSKPGLVVAIGDYIQQDNANPDNEDTKVKPGQRVFLDWSKSLPVNIDNKAAVIIDIEHIKAVINES